MNKHHTECLKFAARLIEALLEAGEKSTRKSATGVRTTKLREVAGVTNEMARRYTLGTAWPDNEKMAKIARWLRVRQEWLRYGEGPKKPDIATEPDSAYVVNTHQGIDKDLLIEILILIDNIRIMHRLDITPSEKAEVTAATYEAALSKGLKSGEIMRSVEEGINLVKSRSA